MVFYSLEKCLRRAFQKRKGHKVMGVFFNSLFLCSKGTNCQSCTLKKSEVFDTQKYELTYIGFFNAKLVKVYITLRNVEAPVHGASPSTCSSVTGNDCICYVKGSS